MTLVKVKAYRKKGKYRAVRTWVHSGRIHEELSTPVTLKQAKWHKETQKKGSVAIYKEVK